MTSEHLRLHKLHTSVALPMLALFVLLLSAATVCFGASTPKPTAPAVPATASSPVIAVADIASRATEVSNLLRNLSAKLAPSPEIEKIEKEFPGAGAGITSELAVTRKLLQDQPPLATLQSQQQLWQGMQEQMTRWLNALTVRATQLQEGLTQLADLQKTWTLTRAAAHAAKAPGPVLQQIDATLSALEAPVGPLQAQRATVLDLQSRVADEVARCENALAQVTQAQRTAVGGILTRDRSPIWNADMWNQAKGNLPSQVPEIADGCWQDIQQYLFHPSKGLPLHAATFLALALICCAARRRLDQWVAGGEGASSSVMIFKRPYAAALIGGMLIGAGTFSPAPPTVRLLFEVLALAPMIRLIRPMVHPVLVPGLYVLGVLFAVDALRITLSGVALIGQAILVFEALAGIVAMRLLHLIRLNRPPVQAVGPSGRDTIEVLAGIVLFILCVGLVAGLLGYMRMAVLMVPGVLAGGALALTLYAVLQVVNGAFAFSLRVWPLRLLQMVEHHRALLERRLYRWMVWIAVLAWFSRYLDYVGLLQPVLSLGSSILATKLERGSMSTSVGEILEFFVTVWVAYLLSRFIRFVLQEDVYPRIGVPKGMSTATSSLIHYILMALGLVVGMGVLGVKLTQVTVLAGAFGVGIGFGLQSVINNFVSGLILLFERPIHVGDTVQLGDLFGHVRRIGIRSSIIHTLQGADIIVPNAQLVTEQVTNWTLSDQLRRIDLPVGLNYGANPQEAIKMMESVAAAHMKVLKYPAPKALFVGYGDSSINFELRVWTDQPDSWLQTRGELGIALYDAVRDAGMSFPFPQREVRILNDAGVVSKPVLRQGASQPPLPESQEKEPVSIEGDRDTHNTKQPG